MKVLKTESIHAKISKGRMEKLRQYAATREKPVTQLIEDWIDQLPTNQSASAQP